jgi:putative ABC transport system permease protein
MISPRSLGLLWEKFTLRGWKRAPVTTLIMVFILGLGVATYLSVRMANRAAISNFELFTEVVNDTSDWVIRSKSGRLASGNLDRVRAITGSLPITILPVLESTCRPTTETDLSSATSYRVVSTDVYALRNFLVETGIEDSALFELDLASDEPGIPAVFSQKIAEAHGLETGDRFEVFMQDQVVHLRVASVFNPANRREQSIGSLVFMDIAALQRVVNLVGFIDRIELVVQEGPEKSGQVAQIGAAIAQNMETDWMLQDQESSGQTTASMTRAFRLNLMVLSLISLLVSIFLILQALDAAVVRRRQEIAVLRSLGLNPRDIQFAWLLEALALGLAGSLLGIVMSWAMAQFLVRQIAQTVNILYRSTAVDSAGLTPGDVGLGLALGIVASLVSGYLPSKDAASTPPAQVIARGNVSEGLAIFRNPSLGWGLLITGAVAAFLPPLKIGSGGAFPVAGYTSAFLLITGTVWIAGYLFRPLSLALLRLPFPSAAWISGMTRLRLAESRQKLAVAGLVIAISMAGGMTILVQSFRTSMLWWLDSSLDADLYISSRSAVSGDAYNRISPETARSIASEKPVRSAIPVARYPIVIDGAETFLAGTDFSIERRSAKYSWIEKPLENWTKDVDSPLASAIVNESFQNRFGVETGDVLNVPTFSGERSIKIVGIHSDYTSERGIITTNIDFVFDWFQSRNVTNLSIFLNPREDISSVISDWTERYPGLNILSYRELREIITGIFSDTFAVTQSIKWLGLFVAICGLALSLFCILLENRRNLQVYRELGMSRREIARTTAFEGLGLAAIGLVCGLILGFILGALLIFVINKQSFGWTLQYAVPGWEMLFFCVFILLTGYLVAFWVGLKNHVLLSQTEV